LIVGSESGHIVWHRNVGKDNRPKFAAARKLLNSSGWDELKEGDIPKAHGGRTKIRVFDYDNDGRLDILLGDVKPTTYQTRPPLSKNEKKLKKKLEAELERIHDREFYDKINALNRKYWDAKNAGNKKEAGGFRAEQDKMREPGNKLYDQLRPTGYKTHGWVWFYHQLHQTTSPLNNTKTDTPIQNQIIHHQPSLLIMLDLTGGTTQNEESPHNALERKAERSGKAV